MNKLPIYIFTISFLFLSFTSFAQEEQSDEEPIDTIIAFKEKYGLRVGIDLVKLVRSFTDDDYRGLEVQGDFRIYKKYYLAAEIGNEDYTYDEPNLLINTKGSYVKIGGNYNAYSNWAGMQNELFVGLRYGFASFSHTLEKYKIYTSDTYFAPDIREVNRDYDGLTGSWIELQFGIKTEILNNLFLSAHVQLKSYLSDKSLNDFETLYVPGFHRTYQDSSIGVGWGYSISYLIPIFKKDKEQEVSN